jgi:hypothetical protein
VHRRVHRHWYEEQMCTATHDIMISKAEMLEPILIFTEHTLKIYLATTQDLRSKD